MKFHRSLLTIAALPLALTACGGGAATQAPGGATTNPGGGGGAATDVPQVTAPVATPSGGGGGGGSNLANGQAHFEITGGHTKSGDLGFLPIASVFGGMDQTLLNFTTLDPNATETLSVTIADGAVAVIYASMDITVTGGECTTSNFNVGATTASGSFECTQTYAVTISGGAIEGVVLKGSFEARA